jgi:hypothetical protein
MRTRSQEGTDPHAKSESRIVNVVWRERRKKAQLLLPEKIMYITTEHPSTDG